MIHRIFAVLQVNLIGACNMKSTLKFIIGLLLLILAGFIMDTYFPSVVFKLLVGIGFLCILYDFWKWVSAKLA